MRNTKQNGFKISTHVVYCLRHAKTRKGDSRNVSGIKQCLIRETCFSSKRAKQVCRPTVCSCCFGTRDQIAYQQSTSGHMVAYMINVSTMFCLASSAISRQLTSRGKAN